MAIRELGHHWVWQLRLTHLPWKKWPPFHKWYFQMHNMKEKFCISVLISLKFVLNGPIDSKTALVQVIAWRCKGDKPLSELMLNQFTDTYAALGRNELIENIDISQTKQSTTISVVYFIGYTIYTYEHAMYTKKNKKNPNHPRRSHDHTYNSSRGLLSQWVSELIVQMWCSYFQN